MYNNSVFLIISHITRIAKGLHTNKKGVSTDPNNYETFENMKIADKVNNRNLLESSVVIDLLNGKVLKNRFSTSPVDTFREYVDRYQNDIADALRKWGVQHPDNYKKLKVLSDLAVAHEAEQVEENKGDANE